MIAKLNKMKSLYVLIFILSDKVVVGQRSPLNDYHRSKGVQLQFGLIRIEAVPMSEEECAHQCTSELQCRSFNYDLQNKECQLLPWTSHTAGTERRRHNHVDLYEKKDYMRECIVNKGVSYRGTVSRTKSGKPCQHWSSNVPHEHRNSPSQFPEKGLDLNYCRNPDNDLAGPWCYTMDWNTRLEDCGIARCDQDVCVTCNGEDYAGFMDHTASGRECQRWDLNYPHEHKYQPEKYPEKNLDDNYCRNPDGSPLPWCYTTDPDVEREYCNIRKCSETHKLKDVEITKSCFKHHGIGYRGRVNQTTSRTPCQRWDAQFPHAHEFTPENYRCKGLQENYCRNPDGSEAPWCFTTDPRVRTAFCLQIKRCEDDIEPEDCYNGNGTTYRGLVNKTRKGISCQRWTSNRPHTPRVTPQTHPNAGLEKNYCRNPDGDSHGPWCYTLDPKVQWDYCAISTCKGNDISGQREDPDSVEFDSCGKRVDRIFQTKSRILRGQPGNSPWTVSLRTREGSHFCGGTLVSRNWIISSKQCFPSCYTEFRGYTAWMGTILKNPGPNDPDKQVISIQRAVCGPKGSNLIMLELERAAVLNSRVAVICLPPQRYIIPEGTQCEIAGWGETQGTGNDDVLNILKMPVISNKECNKYYRGRVAETEICARTVIRGAGACERDYGGPLSCFTNDCWVLEGVIIPGRGCGRLSHPDIFIRVSMYVNWIKKVMEL
ncbi:hepatocyte growth factor-like protein isoform X3 [Hypanus sabinus]|uniref:hepatocyte growth factor-like protein isoform X3 n=1 Tax=Hypanus sabinus TaxID=79690 RepID=UPI0028C430EF|nr:hepatocyte growth factor-like protein isoform X3 [Hypanus sabinus]